jgi:predicted solute-binding protein
MLNKLDQGPYVRKISYATYLKNLNFLHKFDSLNTYALNHSPKLYTHNSKTKIKTIASPSSQSTAQWVLEKYYPHAQFLEMNLQDLEKAFLNKEVDAAIVVHEAHEHWTKLFYIKEDLLKLWQIEHPQKPMPLSCFVVHKNIFNEVELKNIEDALHSLAQKAKTQRPNYDLIEKYAQTKDQLAITQHLQWYVWDQKWN